MKEKNSIMKNENCFSVEFYEHNGKAPARDFIKSQKIKVQAKIFRNIKLLQEYGNFLREPNSKPLKEGIFELRIKESGDNYRVLYFFFKDQRIILTNGFTKKTRKTPKKEIMLALKYKKDFEGEQS